MYGKGWPGPNRERGEDGVDLAMEALLELAELLLAEVLDAADGDRFGGECRAEVTLPEA